MLSYQKIIVLSSHTSTFLVCKKADDILILLTIFAKHTQLATQKVQPT